MSPMISPVPQAHDAGGVPLGQLLVGVTITTRVSLAISWSRSMICTLVSLSRAPVGSSASRMVGWLMRARAMATTASGPPDIWLGRFVELVPRPTFSSTSTARWRRSFLDTPARVRGHLHIGQHRLVGG